MRSGVTAVLLFSLATQIAASPQAGTDSRWPGWPPKHDDRVDIRQLDKTLMSLDKIARENGGNRAFGFSGFDASVDFILKSLKKFDRSRNFRYWTQPFTALWTQVTAHEFTISETETYVPRTLTYSPSTPEGGITADIAIVPGDATPCNAEELLETGADVAGKILLIERGRCPDGTTFAGKVKTGAGAGAASVIIYNNQDPNISGGTLSAPNPEYVPAGLIQRSEGLSIRERVLSGEIVTVHYEQIQLLENKTTVNVFAESKSGNPHNTVMVGAHLDGVQAGPGVNDDGSGTTLILELFRTLDARRLKNKVRFAWWGAEENGLLGSKFYTENMSMEQVDDLLLYLNFDMVGRGYYGVFDGDGSTHGLAGAPGSDVIEALFNRYFESVGIETTPAVFTGGSDYAHFMEDLEKPVGGLHTGTGYDQDPCYHQACDTYENVNQTQLLWNTRAAKVVFEKLIKDGPSLIPKTTARNATSTVRLGKVNGVEWTDVESERHSCKEEI